MPLCFPLFLFFAIHSVLNSIHFILLSVNCIQHVISLMRIFHKKSTDHLFPDLYLVVRICSVTLDILYYTWTVQNFNFWCNAIQLCRTIIYYFSSEYLNIYSYAIPPKIFTYYSVVTKNIALRCHSVSRQFLQWIFYNCMKYA